MPTIIKHQPAERAASGGFRASPSDGTLARCNIWRRIVAVLLLFLATTSAHSQGFSIDWFTIDGGGSRSTGALFSVTGTIGQPDANPQAMTGGNFSLTGGFWSFSLHVGQTSGAPSLRIFATMTNTVVVAWPAPFTGFTLQQNTDLATANWVDVTSTPILAGIENQVIVSPLSENRFYRLIKP